MTQTQKAILILIEGVRRTHGPIWWIRKHGILAETLDPWCVGCKGLVSHKKCPALQAALELEKENESDESG